MRILPTRRRAIAIGAVALVAAGTWWLWTPGLEIRDGRHDRGANGIWMQHGWLGDDAWFRQNGKDSEESALRDPARLVMTAAALREHHIRYVFPHLSPADPSGAIARSDAAQVERFLDAFGAAGIDVLPWVGGVRGESARPADAAWRGAFVRSCAALLTDHPRLAGVHVNMEPMPNGDADFLRLLEDLRAALPAGKRISVAAYPPPTRWQQMPDVHWDRVYAQAIAVRVDQVVVMMYDTSLRSTKFYEQLMKDWTREALAWYAPREVLFGVPAYEDAGVSYHDPAVENLRHALAGIHAGLGDVVPANYAGVSIYCEWEMTADKWRVYEELFEATGRR